MSSISSTSLRQLERTLSGLSMISIPLLLFVGFILHPQFWSFSLTRDASTLLDNFRHESGFHIGHLLVMITVAPILVMTFRFHSVLRVRPTVLGLIGGLLAGLGAVMLAIDKGSLTLVLAGFDTLSDSELAQITPALEVIASRGGWLAITWLIALLPIGAAMQTLSIHQAGHLKAWQAASTIAGLLLLLNPDIKIIGAAGALLMCAGYVPLGWRELRGQLM